MSSEQFNMNIAWLEDINALIKMYIHSRFIDDFDSMFKALDMLESMTSPKIENDTTEKMLNWLENNIDKWCIRDNLGKLLRVNYENKKVLQKKFNSCFRSLLLKLDKKGILTKKSNFDPYRAIVDGEKED